jgi:hypothetical protein
LYQTPYLTIGRRQAAQLSRAFALTGLAFQGFFERDNRVIVEIYLALVGMPSELRDFTNAYGCGSQHNRLSV